MNRRTIIILIFFFAAILGVAAILIFINSQDTPPDTDTGGSQPDTTEGEVTDGEVVSEDGGDGEDQPESGSSIGDAVADLVSGEEETAVPTLVEVVVSLQTVPRGHQMSEDILTIDFRNVQDVGSNVITSMEDAVGLYARTDIFQGETLTRDALVRDPTFVGLQEYGPSALIPPGFIAMAIPLDLLGAASGVSEGDFVDIMSTFNLYRIDEQFQTFLENNATFFIDDFLAGVQENPPEDESTFASDFEMETFFVVPFGRFEELANGDLVLVSPSEFQRPIPITMVLQNAKVIQIGNYVVPPPASIYLPTATPKPLEEGAETPTPEAVPTATPTSPPPDIIVVALSPQQQLFLKHAIEVGADIDFALRGSSDNQLFEVDQVDFQFLLDFFNIEIPPNFDFTIDTGSVEGTGAEGGSSPGAGETAPTSTPSDGG